MTLFGDIGGFSSFFFVLLGLFVGSMPGTLLNMSTTASLFRANLSADETSQKGIFWFDSTRKLEFKKVFKLKQILGWLLTCFRKEHEKRLERILRKGSDKIEKMLDIRTIIKHQRALETLKRLLVPKQTRKLINM